MTTVTTLVMVPVVAQSPLFSTFGSDAFGVLGGHAYTSAATVTTRPVVRPGGTLQITSKAEVSEEVDTDVAAKRAVATNDNNKRTIGVVKNGLIAGTALMYTHPNGTSADVSLNSKGVLLGSVSVLQNNRWLPSMAASAGVNTTSHDIWLAPITERYVSTSYVSPWLALSVRGHQTVPRDAYGDTSPLSDKSPAYVTASISNTLPVFDRGWFSDKRSARASPFSVGHQLKWPLAGGSPTYDFGVEYNKMGDASVTVRSTGGVTGMKFDYYVPVSPVGNGLRAVAASMDVHPTNTSGINAFDVWHGRAPGGGIINMRREGSLGAVLGFGRDWTGKVRLNSEGTLQHKWMYAINSDVILGAAQKVSLTDRKSVSFGLQMDILS